MVVPWIVASFVIVVNGFWANFETLMKQFAPAVAASREFESIRQIFGKSRLVKLVFGNRFYK